MKWVSKSKDMELVLPDTMQAGIWWPIKIREQSWELCWEPILRTLFLRQHAGSPECPIKYRTATSKRFPGEMFAEILLEYVGGPKVYTQSLSRELAIHVPGLDSRRQAAGSQGELVRSPMVGKILRVLLAAGDHVERGQELLVIEAMKMENKIYARSTGKIAELHAVTGSQVSVGQALMLIQAE